MVHIILPDFANRNILPTLSNFSGKVFWRLFYLNVSSKPKKFSYTFFNYWNQKWLWVLFVYYHFLFLYFKQRPVQSKISEGDPYPYPLLLFVYITSHKFNNPVFIRFWKNFRFPYNDKIPLSIKHLWAFMKIAENLQSTEEFTKASATPN